MYKLVDTKPMVHRIYCSECACEVSSENFYKLVMDWNKAQRHDGLTPLTPRQMKKKALVIEKDFGCWNFEHNRTKITHNIVAKELEAADNSKCPICKRSGAKIHDSARKIGKQAKVYIIHGHGTWHPFAEFILECSHCGWMNPHPEKLFKKAVFKFKKGRKRHARRF